jgi:hypothetical protein
MNLKELKIKAEGGDPIACYELGLAYKGKNYSSMLTWLHASAIQGHRPAIVELAALYTSKRSLIDRIDEEACAELNDIACSLIKEDANEENKKIAYTFFRIASIYNDNALRSLAYCKLEGIGVKKDAKGAYEIIYANKLDEDFIVLESQTNSGISYRPKKTKTAKKVQKRIKKNEMINKTTTVLSFLLKILFFPLDILFFPYLLCFKFIESTDNNYTGEREPTDGAALLGGLFLGCGIYFLILNVLINKLLSHIFGVSGFFVILSVAVTLFILSVIYAVNKSSK